MLLEHNHGYSDFKDKQGNEMVSRQIFRDTDILLILAVVRIKYCHTLAFV